MSCITRWTQALWWLSLPVIVLRCPDDASQVVSMGNLIMLLEILLSDFFFHFEFSLVLPCRSMQFIHIKQYSFFQFLQDYKGSGQCILIIINIWNQCILFYKVDKTWKSSNAWSMFMFLIVIYLSRFAFLTKFSNIYKKYARSKLNSFEV